jgi:hypothetical protein
MYTHIHAHIHTHTSIHVQPQAAVVNPRNDRKIPQLAAGRDPQTSNFVTPLVVNVLSEPCYKNIVMNILKG